MSKKIEKAGAKYAKGVVFKDRSAMVLKRKYMKDGQYGRVFDHHTHKDDPDWYDSSLCETRTRKAVRLRDRRRRREIRESVRVVDSFGREQVPMLRIYQNNLNNLSAKG